MNPVRRQCGIILAVIGRVGLGVPGGGGCCGVLMG